MIGSSTPWAQLDIVLLAARFCSLSSLGGRRGPGRGGQSFPLWCRTTRRSRLLDDLLGPRRHKAIVLRFAHHLRAASAPVQGLPDVCQHTFAVPVPLVIPEARYLDAGFGKELFADFISHQILRQAVLRTIQFDGKPRSRAIKVEVVTVYWMLAAKFEPRETAGAERAPQLLRGLLAPQAASVGC